MEIQSTIAVPSWLNSLALLTESTFIAIESISAQMSFRVPMISSAFSGGLVISLTEGGGF